MILQKDEITLINITENLIRPVLHTEVRKSEKKL